MNTDIKNKAFPSLKSLLILSWETFTKSILNLIILTLLSMFSFLLVLLVFGLVFFIVGKKSGLFSSLSNLSHFDLLSFLSVNSSVLITASLVALLIVIFSILIGLVIKISSILIVADEARQLSLGKAIKSSFCLIVPFMLTELLTSLFVLGGFFVLFFPALLINFFFMFVPYEVILGGKKLLVAIKSSINIISQYFGEVLGRALFYFLIYLIIVVFIPSLFSKVDSQAAVFFNLMSVIVNVLLGFYGLCYSITLYKQAKKLSDLNRKPNIVWLWVVAGLGWLMLGLAVLAGYKLLKSGFIQDKLVKEFQQEKKEDDKILTFAPSSCGLAVPVPKTTDAYQDKDRKWLYEEKSLSPKEFYVLDSDVYPVDKVLGAFIGYKDVDMRLGGEEFTVADPGLNIYCTDNYKSLNLEEFKSLALTNKNFKVTAEDKVKWGEVELIPVWLEGELNGQQLKEPAYLGVSQDNNRLIYIRIWSVSDDDPLKQDLEDDIDVIIDNLKYRQVSGELSDIKPAEDLGQNKPPSKTVTKPACVPYAIREGEFASDKCYSQKDYDDLIYYLQRYNSAVFSYNSAVSSMRITCTGSEFFKNTCKLDKQKKQKVEEDMVNYKNIINGIIARGT